ncbi:dephospho-CoA kinase [Aminomonas paucivorans]|uniref:dephospho-CoA kinase n=1 Tax=Aminomonas paucivorans TaxID=81412 RepID=UPI00332CBFA8
MFVVAVSGDIGAGKSTLTRLWADLGAEVTGADEVAKSLWGRPEIRAAAASRWGDELFDPQGTPRPGEFLRTAFASREDHRFLGELLHPLVWDLLKERSGRGSWRVLEVPLLFETGVPEWVDATVYVTAQASVREERVARSRGWATEDLALRERWLLPGEEKARRARWTLANDGDRDAFLREGRNLGLLFRRLASVVEGDTACGSPDEAARIARALVEGRLVACVQTTPTRSLFRWKGRVEEHPEWVLSFRTLEEYQGPVERRIRELHRYELPVVSFRVPSRLGLDARLWVTESCGP